MKSLTVLKIVASMKKLCIFNYTIASNNVSKDLVKIVMTNINHNHKILRSVRVCLSVCQSFCVQYIVHNTLSFIIFIIIRYRPIV